MIKVNTPQNINTGISARFDTSAATVDAGTLNMIGQQSNRAAGSMQQIYQEADRNLSDALNYQLEVNKAAAENAAQAMQVKSQEIMSELSTIKGAAAVNLDAEEEVRKRYSEYLKTVDKGLKNDQQRQIFDNHSFQIERSLLNAATKHKIKEVASYNKEVLDSSAQLAGRSLMLAADDNERQQAIGNIQGYISKLGQLEGWSEEKVLIETQKRTSESLSALIDTQLKNGNIDAANEMMTKYAAYLSGTEIIKTKGFVEEEIARQAADINADALTNANGGTVTIRVADGGDNVDVSAFSYDKRMHNSASLASLSTRARDAQSTFNALSKGGEAATNVTTIARMAVQSGFSPEQAAVIAGNIYREHGASTKGIYNKNIHSDEANKKLNYGMINWQGSRAKEFDAFVRARGMNPSNLSGESGIKVQLDFMMQEMRSKEAKNSRAFLNAKTPKDAAKGFESYIRWDAEGKVLRGNTGKHFGKMDGATAYAYQSIGGSLSRGGMRDVAIDTSSEEAIRRSAREGGMLSKQIDDLVASYNKRVAAKEREKKDREDAIVLEAENALVSAGGDYDSLPPSIRAKVRGSMGAAKEEELRRYGHSLRTGTESRLAYENVVEIEALANNEARLKSMSPQQLGALIPRYGRNAVADLLSKQNRLKDREKTGSDLKSEKAPSSVEMLMARDAAGLKELKGDEATYAKFNIQNALDSTAQKLGRNLTPAERTQVIREVSQTKIKQESFFGLLTTEKPVIAQKPYE